MSYITLSFSRSAARNGCSYTSQQRNRGRRATRDLHIYGEHVGYPATHGITGTENPTPAATVADSDYQLRIRSRFINSFQRTDHVLGDGSGNQKHVGMTRASDEFDPGSFQVVIGIGEGVNFQLASVARSRIDMSNAQGPAQSLQDARIDLTAQAPMVFGRRQGFGDDTDSGNLF